MGAKLFEARPDIFKRYLSRADAVAGLPVSRRCVEGPAEALMCSDVAQPALFSLSAAITELAADAGIQPSFVAGHSLGEYTAAVTSGALDFEDGLELVALRGRLMAEVQRDRPGAMAAIIGPGPERVAELCREATAAGSVAIASLNAPAQTVVSGDAAGVGRVMELAAARGVLARRLPVGAAFHSALMEPVRVKMAAALRAVRFRDPRIATVSNASGELLTTADGVAHALIAQITSPVRWVECVRALDGAGVSRYLELGAGRVLRELVREILGDQAAVSSAESPRGLATFLAERTLSEGS